MKSEEVRCRLRPQLYMPLRRHLFSSLFSFLSYLFSLAKLYFRSWRSWITQQIPILKNGGSNPFERAKKIRSGIVRYCSLFYFVLLTRRDSKRPPNSASRRAKSLGEQSDGLFDSRRRESLRAGQKNKEWYRKILLLILFCSSNEKGFEQGRFAKGKLQPFGERLQSPL